jgi:hypothetical protein
LKNPVSISKKRWSFDMDENIDELEDHFCKKVEPTEGEAIKLEHVMMEKVSI